MTWCSVDSATPRFDLASSAIRCRFVDRFVRPNVLSRVSRQRSSPRDAPLPSIGSRWVQFPDVVSTMRALRLPTHAFPVAYLLRFRGPHDSPAVRARFAALPCRRRPQQRARIVVQPVIRLARLLHRVDVSGSSQVPRQSILCLCSGPRPRPNRRSLATSGLVGAAPARETAKAPASTDIGATPGLWHLLSTLHGGCCHCPCNTRFRLAGSPLPGGS